MAATFKTEIRKHQQREDGSYNIKLRITHKRRSRWIPTNITITPQDLTARGDKVRTQAVLDKCVFQSCQFVFFHIICV